MKQIITIFKAEGSQAKRMIGLFRRTPRAQLARLRDTWREDIRTNTRLSAYVEYMDGWSMGDDFQRIIGSTSTKRGMANGEMFALRVSRDTLAHLRAQSRRKHQFTEQVLLARQLASLAKGSGECGQPVTLVIFREVVGVSVPDEELKEGSNKPRQRTG
jgi:hypothetical protein